MKGGQNHESSYRCCYYCCRDRGHRVYRQKSKKIKIKKITAKRNLRLLFFCMLINNTLTILKHFTNKFKLLYNLKMKENEVSEVNAIETSQLCKRYAKKPAVDKIDLVVPTGAIYGFIGRNGSGKTTTQKMVSGLARPTSGSIKLFGKPVESQDVRSQIGVLIEQPALFAELSAYENLMLQGLNTGIKDPKSQAMKSLEMVDLKDAASKKTKQLSLGMKQRLGVAVAMMASPKLLILDEPINGLDPQGIIEMRGVFERLNKEMGITIFISSHILGELSRIATHYGILHEGQLIQQISAKELAEKSRDYLQIRVNDTEKAYCLLKEKMNLNECTVHENSIHLFGFDNGRIVNELLWKNGLVADEIYLHRQDLEEYFLALMGGVQVA